MNMAFQDSKTYQNLLVAYEKELLLSAKYLIYSDIARNTGYIEISNVYDTTVINNKEHARIWLRRINEGNLPSLPEVLHQSMQEELQMSSDMYQKFADTASEEGYDDIRALFSGVANIDYNHSTQFRVILENVNNDQVFCKPEARLWICMQCGNIMSGECAPIICPVCGFPQGFYRLYI
jgi:rubrerythrin